MFSRLKNLFRPDQLDQPDAQDENPNFITRPRRIRTLLYLLIEDHTQVSVELDDDHAYSSAVREVSDDGVRIDELNAQEGHARMKPGRAIKIRAKHQAVHLIFESTVSDALSSGYLIKLPNKVYYPQRRSFYRVPLNSLASYAFRAWTPYADQPISGRIEDMSYGGICLAINDAIYFKKGDLLSPASLILNDGEVVNCDLVICTVNKSRATGTTRLGCEFSDIDANARKSVNQFIVYCERERAKKGMN